MKRVSFEISKSQKIIIIAALLFIIFIQFYVLKISPPMDNLSDLNQNNSRSFWEKAIDRRGAEDSYREFKKYYSKKSFSDAHLASHVFGELLFDKMGMNGITICDTSFAFGCYHGFFTQAIAVNGLSVVAKLDQACIDKFGTENASPCKHGMGHGLVEFLGHDKANLVKALSSCETENKEKGSQQYFGCFSGVFMEYDFPILISAGRAEMSIRPLGDENAHDTCESLPEKFKNACYFSMGQWWEKVYNYNYPKIGYLCDSIENMDYKKSCFKGIGNVVGPSADYKPQEVIKRCAQIINHEGEALCLSTAAWTVAEQNNSINDAMLICKKLGEEEKKLCPSNK